MLGDADNRTDTCVPIGARAVECVGCSASPGMVNYADGRLAYTDPARWWPHVLLDFATTLDVTRGSGKHTAVR